MNKTLVEVKADFITIHQTGYFGYCWSWSLLFWFSWVENRAELLHSNSVKHQNVPASLLLLPELYTNMAYVCFFSTGELGKIK